jgi:molecular chaperone GrpE
MITNNHSHTKGSQAADKNGHSADSAGPAVGQPARDVDLSQTEAMAEAIEEAVTTAADQGPSRIKQLQGQLAEAEDRVLRAYAELDNYRKRANRLLQEETKYAPLPLVRDLLPAVDNLERAIQSAEQSGGSAGLLEGVKMVAQQLRMVLERHHCRRIEAKGSPFDPNLHEAITQIPSQELPPGTVAEVLQTGYQLHERIVRPAQVMVSTRSAAESPGAADAEATED